MNSIELGEGVKSRNFLGVFPINKIPRIKMKNNSLHFAVNNQTANLPGQHWIAVSVFRNNSAYVFDPLALPPPQLLINELRKRGIVKIIYNKVQVQALGSTNCGELVQQYLNINKKDYV